MNSLFLLSFFFLLFLSTFTFTLSAHSTTFEGNPVFRLRPTHENQLHFLKDLAADDAYDFWTRISLTQPVDLHVSRDKITETKEKFQEHGIEFEVIIENLQELVDLERQSLGTRSSPPTLDETYFQNFHTFEENINWLKSLSQTFSNMTKLIKLGTTFEGRELLAVHVFSPKKTGEKKRSIWVDGGMHAREWVSPTTVNYLLWRFVVDYETDSEVQKILDQIDLYILPMFNPDGYAYSWEKDRMWRKNRVVHPDSSCIGTDLNRNWGYAWDSPDSNTKHCSSTFRGSKPFSENETKSVSDFLSSVKQGQGLIGYMNVHCYGQYWIYPWGYSTTPAADDALMYKSAKKSVNALTEVYGTKYQYGQGSVLMYPASGSVEDWVYGVLKVVYSMVVELRDTGRYGFILPANQILPTGIETFAGFKKFCQHTINQS